jgi:hypothetical protein
MAYGVLTYNGKTITLGKPPLRIACSAAPPRTVTTTITGEQKTVTLPRVDALWRIEWPVIEDAAVRTELENFWSWAVQGNTWTLALDSTKTVNTTFSGAEAAGQTVLSITLLTGITNAQVYKICDGPNYELVTVSTSGGGTVTVVSAINLAYGSGAIFRDRFYFVGMIRDPGARSPITDVSQIATMGPARFQLILEFYEDLTT